MTWYEKVDGKHRARRYKPGTRQPDVGPRFATEAEAKRWAITNGWDEGFSHKLLDVVAEWRRVRESEAAEHQTIDPRFLAECEFRLGSVFKKLGWVDVREISISEFNRWRTTEGIGFKRNADYLLAILRWARRNLKITVDQDIIDWRFPRKRHVLIARKKLTTEQVLDIVEAGIAFGPHVHGLLHYLTTYGARPATACGLTIGQVNFTDGTLDLRAKHSGEWRHRLQERTLEIFATLTHKRDPSDRLFLRPFIGSGTLTQMITRDPWQLTATGEAHQLCNWYPRHITKPLGLPDDLVQIYHLKRYAITTALRNGLTPKEVALFTGHLSTEQVLKYAETNEQESGDVVDFLGPSAELDDGSEDEPKARPRRRRPRGRAAQNAPRNRVEEGNRIVHTGKHTKAHRVLKRKPR